MLARGESGAHGMAARNWLSYLTERIALRTRKPDAVHQSGAIPYTVVRGQMVFLIVTSRRSGRWIFPKGAPIEGMTPWQVAAHEAFEEAGVEGEVDPVPIGAYRTMKTLTLSRSVIEVDMYPLRVTRQLEAWPEQGARYRHWVILPDAKRLLSEPQLAALATRLSRRVGPQAQPAMGRMRA